MYNRSSLKKHVVQWKIGISIDKYTDEKDICQEIKYEIFYFSGGTGKRGKDQFPCKDE